MKDSFEIFEMHEEGKPYKISHRCFYFSKEVILFVRDCKYEPVYRSLFDQLIRSATSVGANVVEGKSGSSKKGLEKLFCYSIKIGK